MKLHYKRCSKGYRSCGSKCKRYEGLTRIYNRCPKGKTRCPSKVGTCLKTRRRRRH